MAEPTSRLQDPAEHTESILGQPFSNPGAAFDWLSPTHIVNEFIKATLGYDIFGEAAKVFGGDWELVWQAAGAFRNLAAAMQDIGVNIASGNLHLDGEWDGRAADAAYTYFTGLGSSISAQQIGLTALAESYVEAAEGTYRIAETVSGILKDISDAALIAVIATSAGTATIETGVGAVAGYSFAAYEVYKIYQLGDRAKKLITTAYNIIHMVVGQIQAVSTDTGPLARYPLPAGPYRHPASA